MWINPTTHRVRFSGVAAGPSLATATVQYLVMEGVNVIRKETVMFGILTASPAIMNPTLDAGQSWQIQSINLLADANCTFAIQRITTGGSPAGQIAKGALLVNEWGVYADYTWTRYTTDGVPYPLPVDGGGGGGAPEPITSLTLPITDPATPATDELAVYARKLGGRMMLAQKGPSGLDTTFQANLGGNKVALWMPPGGATTVPGVFGMGALTAVGTATARAVATTNILTRMSRIGYVSAATAGALASIREAVARYTTGAGSGLGGFFLRVRFGPSDAAVVAGARMFVGMQAATGAATNVEPSTLANSIGVAQLSTSQNLHIVARDATTGITPIDLGADFPAHLNSVAYELTLFSPPSGGVSWQVTRLNHSAVASGTLSGSIPLGTQLITFNSYRTNNATALAVGLDLCGLMIETDY